MRGRLCVGAGSGAGSDASEMSDAPAQSPLSSYTAGLRAFHNYRVFIVKSGSPCQIDCRPFGFQFDKCTGQVHVK